MDGLGQERTHLPGEFAGVAVEQHGMTGTSAEVRCTGGHGGSSALVRMS
jgi:hypothetical protein